MQDCFLCRIVISQRTIISTYLSDMQINNVDLVHYFICLPNQLEPSHDTNDGLIGIDLKCD